MKILGARSLLRRVQQVVLRLKLAEWQSNARIADMLSSALDLCLMSRTMGRMRAASWLVRGREKAAIGRVARGGGRRPPFGRA